MPQAGKLAERPFPTDMSDDLLKNIGRQAGLGGRSVDRIGGRAMRLAQCHHCALDLRGAQTQFFREVLDVDILGHLSEQSSTMPMMVLRPWRWFGLPQARQRREVGRHEGSAGSLAEQQITAVEAERPVALTHRTRQQRVD